MSLLSVSIRELNDLKNDVEYESRPYKIIKQSQIKQKIALFF